MERCVTHTCPHQNTQPTIAHSTILLLQPAIAFIRETIVFPLKSLSPKSSDFCRSNLFTRTKSGQCRWNRLFFSPANHRYLRERIWPTWLPIKSVLWGSTVAIKPFRVVEWQSRSNNQPAFPWFFKTLQDDPTRERELASRLRQFQTQRRRIYNTYTSCTRSKLLFMHFTPVHWIKSKEDGDASYESAGP